MPCVKYFWAAKNRTSNGTIIAVDVAIIKIQLVEDRSLKLCRPMAMVHLSGDCRQIRGVKNSFQ